MMSPISFVFFLAQSHDPSYYASDWLVLMRFMAVLVGFVRFRHEEGDWLRLEKEHQCKPIKGPSRARHAFAILGKKKNMENNLGMWSFLNRREAHWCPHSGSKVISLLTCTHTILHGLLTEFACCRSANTFFELEWRDGRVCVRAANGKYVIAKKNGQLAATVDNAGEWSSDVSELKSGRKLNTSACGNAIK